MKMLNKKVMLALCSLILVGNALIAQDAKYVGSATCKMCHNSPTKGRDSTEQMGTLGPMPKLSQR